MSDGLHEDVGLLTWSQWVKAQDALSRAGEVVEELRMIGSARIRQEGGVGSPEPALPLHKGWLAAEALSGMLRELYTGWQDDDDGTAEEHAANDHEGARLLLRIVSAVQAAYHRFPIGEERAHVVPVVVCQQDGCHGRVRYRPPLEFLDDVRYTCVRCHAEQDIQRVIDEVTTKAQAIEQEKTRAKRLRAKQRRDREEERAYGALDSVG